MAWQSQMQAGTGRGGNGLIGGGTVAQTYGAPVAPSRQSPNPYALSEAFAQHYGGMPTHQIVSGMQQGQPPQGAPAPQLDAGASVGAEQASVTSTPEQAGAMNAASPGIFNGNPANGYPSEDAGFSEALRRGPPGRQRGAQPPAPPKAITEPMKPVAPPQAPPPAVAPPAAPPPAAALPAAPPPAETAPSQIKPSAVPQTASGAPATAQAQQAPPVTPESGSPAKAATDAGAATGTQRNFGGLTYNLAEPLPAGFVNWTQKKKDAWLADPANASVASPMQQQAIQAGGDYLTLNAQHQLPTEDPNGPAPVTITPGMSPVDIDNLVGHDKYLGQIASAAANLYHVGTQTQQEAGFTGSQAQFRNWQIEQVRKLNAYKGVLAAYGIYLPDNAPPTGGGAGGGTGGTGDTGGTGGTGTGGGTGGGTGTPQTETPIVPGPDAPLVGGVATEFEGTNLDLSNPTTTFNKILNGYIKQGFSADKAVAMAAADFDAMMAQALANNRQSAVNLMGGALGSFQDSPLYKGVQANAQDQLTNPSLVPWDTVNNQFVAGQAKGTQQAMGELDASLQRRGLGAATGAGIAADTARQSSGDVAMGLGQLEIQKAQHDEQMRQAALSNAIAAMGGTSGVALSQSNILGSMIAGQPQDYANPYASVPSNFVNADAAEAAQNGGGSSAVGIGAGALAGAAAGAPLGPWGIAAGALIGGFGAAQK